MENLISNLSGCGRPARRFRQRGWNHPGRIDGDLFSIPAWGSVSGIS